MGFSLVVLDLDGTLLNPHCEEPIRPRVCRAVRALVKGGVRATLATGRTWEYARFRAEELGLEGSFPMVAGQGASLVEIGTGKIFHEVTLPSDLCARIAERAQQGDEVISLYCRDPRGQLHITLNRLERDFSYYRHLLGPETKVVEDLGSCGGEGWSLLKFVVFTEVPEDGQRWQRWVGDQAHVGRTHHHLIEGTAAGVDKGSGVRALLAHTGIPPQDVLAIGDQENDIPMFSSVGLAVAMGQAPDTVKARAAWVAPCYEEDGVAAALEHFFPQLVTARPG